MLEFKVGNKQISIKLTPGLYGDLGDSGNGKTYLHKLLDSADSTEDVSICSISMIENIDMKSYTLRRLQEKKYDFIFLDRYDLYCSKSINEVLHKLSKETPVLIDLKNINRLGKFIVRYALVGFTEEDISVIEQNYI